MLLGGNYEVNVFVVTVKKRSRSPRAPWRKRQRKRKMKRAEPTRPQPERRRRRELPLVVRLSADVSPTVCCAFDAVLLIQVCCFKTGVLF